MFSKLFAVSAALVLFYQGATAQAQSTSANVEVYVAYAENERPPIYFPDPWLGSPNTIFLGYPGVFWDTGGILIYNAGSTNVLLSRGAKVDGFANGASFQLWDNLIPSTGVTIPPGYRLILAETGAQVASGQYVDQACIPKPGTTCFSNFDTSDTPVVSPPSWLRR